MMAIIVDTQNSEQIDSSGTMNLIFIREVPSSNVGRNVGCPDFGYFGVSPDRFRYMKVNVGLCSCFGTSFPIRYLLIMLPSDAVCSDLLTEALPGTQVK
jgi:hypothetical protein